MKGTIYLISNSVDDRIYIGSTANSIVQRMGQHRSSARSGCSNDFHEHMRKVGVSKWTIEAIKIREVKDRKELEKLEFNCMSNYPKKLLLNSNKAYGERSLDHRRKASISSRGDKTSKFKRGSIKVYSHTRGENIFRYVTFSWRSWEGDVCHIRQKTFSIKKYGERNAMKMAKEYQNKIYPKPE